VALRRPTVDEFGGHFGRYIALVPETDVVTAFELQAGQIERWPARVPPEKESVPYADGKWTPRQVVGHLGDVERIFAYRVLRISRRDETPLPGFEQDPFVDHAPFAQVPLQLLVGELVALRRANLPLFRRLDEDAWASAALVSGARVTARALAYAMVGHVRYHAALFREKYGLALEA
jgi:hypothetical protein